jgi:hypothetical protein
MPVAEPLAMADLMLTEPPTSAPPATPTILLSSYSLLPTASDQLVYSWSEIDWRGGVKN